MEKDKKFPIGWSDKEKLFRKIFVDDDKCSNGFDYSDQEDKKASWLYLIIYVWFSEIIWIMNNQSLLKSAPITALLAMSSGDVTELWKMFFRKFLRWFYNSSNFSIGQLISTLTSFFVTCTNCKIFILLNLVKAFLIHSSEHDS